MPLNYQDPEVARLIEEMGRSGYTQAGVDEVYRRLGLPNPPLVPASLTGRVINTRGGPRFESGAAPDAAGRDFLNRFGTEARDPYREQSGISNLAGGVLAAVGTAVGGPVWTALSTGANLGNQALGNGSSASDFGDYGQIGSALGAIYGAYGGPGSYGSTPTNGAIDESGAMGGAGTGGIGSGAGGMSGNFSWMDWVGPLINAGASLIGADRANDAVQDGTREATGEARRQFDLVRSDTAPTRALGAAAVDRIARYYGYGTPDGKPDMSAFFESPDYRYNLEQTEKAAERTAAARGGLLSGGAVLEAQRNASGLASRENAGFVDRLMQQAGLGNTGIGASASAGANTANTVANAAMNSGNTRASIYGQTANNLNNSIQGGMQNALLRRYLGT
jgi:hypothetical protein